eukprot:351670-Chlamydomonas_euryale.AAC.1
MHPQDTCSSRPQYTLRYTLRAPPGIGRAYRTRASICRRLLSQAFELQPRLLDALAEAAPQLAGNLQELAARGMGMAAAVTQRNDAAAVAGIVGA